MTEAEEGLIVVRPRSTSRKRRTTGDRATPRNPAQLRSRERRDRILDASEELLRLANIEDLSLSDIGARAGMSKASVHYHFPTVAAIQFELGRRHDRQLRDQLLNGIFSFAPGRPASWQEWMRFEAGLARAYFNANRAACETILGPVLHRDNRLTTIRDNSELGQQTLRGLQRLFELPPHALLEGALPYYGEILDTFWSGAYLARGHIDDRSFEESMRAGLSYLRNFLPDVMAVRGAENRVEAARAQVGS